MPGVGGVGQHLAAQEGFYAAFVEQGDLLGVAQFGIGFVLDYGGLAANGGGEQAVERGGLRVPARESC